jgi:hypothetical protein
MYAAKMYIVPEMLDGMTRFARENAMVAELGGHGKLMHVAWI